MDDHHNQMNMARLIAAWDNQGKTELKHGDILKGSIRNDVVFYASVDTVSCKYPLIGIYRQGVTPNNAKLEKDPYLKVMGCLDKFVSQESGWKIVECTAPSQSALACYRSDKKSLLSLSAILFFTDEYYRDRRFDNPLMQKSIFTFLSKTREAILSKDICLHNELKLAITERAIFPDEQPWKKLLNSGKRIYLYEPDYEVYLGSVKSAGKGFIYRFTTHDHDHDHDHFIFINRPYVNIFVLSDYWHIYLNPYDAWGDRYEPLRPTPYRDTLFRNVFLLCTNLFYLPRFEKIVTDFKTVNPGATIYFKREDDGIYPLEVHTDLFPNDPIKVGFFVESKHSLNYESCFRLKALLQRSTCGNNRTYYCVRNEYCNKPNAFIDTPT